MEIKPFDVVALLEDQPSQGLLRGQVGTVVETLAPGASTSNSATTTAARMRPWL